MRKIRTLLSSLLILLLGIFYLPIAFAGPSISNVKISNQTDLNNAGDTLKISWNSSNQEYYFFYLYNWNSSGAINTSSFLSDGCNAAGSDGSDGCLGQSSPSTAKSVSWDIPSQLEPGTYTIKVAVWDSAGNAKGDFSDWIHIKRLQKPSMTNAHPSSGSQVNIDDFSGFSWGHVSGTNTYRIVISKDYPFNGFSDTETRSSFCSNTQVCQTDTVDCGRNEMCYPADARYGGPFDNRGNNPELKPNTKYCWNIRAGVLENSSIPLIPHSVWADGGCFTTSSTTEAVNITVVNPPATEDEKVKITYTPVNSSISKTVSCYDWENNSTCSITTEKGKEVKVYAIGSDVDTNNMTKLDYWNSDCFSETTGIVTFDADDDCSIRAYFKPVTTPTTDYPDYTVTSIEVEPNQTQFAVGDTIDIFADVENIGKKIGEDSKIHWIKSASTINDRNDGELIRSDSQIKLSSGQKADFSTQITLSSSGQYRLGACIEMEEGIESNLSNNCADISINVAEELTDYSLIITPPTNGDITINYPNPDGKSDKVNVICPSNCGEFSIPEGTQVTLTAKPSDTQLYSFVGWNGDCISANDANKSTATITINSDCKNVVANFGVNNLEPSNPVCSSITQPIDIESQPSINLTWDEVTDPNDNQNVGYWLCSKKNDNSISYPQNCQYAESAAFTLSNLAYESTYYWKILAVDNQDSNVMISSEVCSFSTLKENKAPEITKRYLEPQGSDNLPLEPVPTLKCEAEDDGGNDSLVYTFFFSNAKQSNGLDNPYQDCTEMKTCECTPKTELEFNNTYYWNVIAIDTGNKQSEKGSPLNFSTRDNTAPHKPHSPQLTNGTDAIPAPFENIDPTKPVILTWEGGDPDVDDTVTYDVNFVGEDISCQDPTPLTEASCTIAVDQLQKGKTYTWNVTATDNHGKTAIGAMGEFSTEANQAPTPALSGIIKQNGNVVDVANGEKVDVDDDLTFEWQPSTDEEGDDISYMVCYANLADSDIKTAINQPDADKEAIRNTEMKCISPYEDTLSKTLLPKNVNRLVPDANYAWIVSAQDSMSNKSDWEIWEFSTQPPDGLLTLFAYSGAENTSLDWQLDAGEPDKIQEFRLLRVPYPEEGEPVFTDEDEVENGRTVDWKFLDEDALEEGTEYCYRVDALDNVGNILLSSSFNRNINCVVHGVTKAGVGSANADEGEEISVPVITPNGGSLKIQTATICLGYDSNVLEVTAENTAVTTTFSDYYNIDVSEPEYFTSEDLATLPNGVNAAIKATLSFTDGFSGTEAPDLDELAELQGPGSLLNFNFKVKEGIVDDPNIPDYSIVKILDKIEEFAGNEPGNIGADADIGQDIDYLDNCSLVKTGTLYAPQNVRMDFRNVGKVGVRSRLRNGDRRVESRIYVKAAHSKGDLDGDGYVSHIDSLIAHAIAANKFATPSTEQIVAANVVHLDEVDTSLITGIPSKDDITSADVKRIADYVINQTWDVQEPNTRRRIRNSNEATTFKFEDLHATSDSTIEVILQVDNLSSLFALDMEIGFDTGVVAVKKVELDANGIAKDTPVVFLETIKDGIVYLSLYTRGNDELHGTGGLVKFTFELLKDASINRTALYIGKTGLYDRYGRNFVTSSLQRKVEKHNGSITLTDIPANEDSETAEQTVINVPLHDLLPSEEVDTYSIGVLTVDDNSKPIENVAVTVNSQTVMSNSKGYTAISGLSANTYTLTATKAGYTFEPQTCTVSDVQHCVVTFTAAHNNEADQTGRYAVYGTVVDQNDQPTSGISVGVGGHSTITDDSGYFAVIGLTAGNYPVTLSQDAQVIAEQTCTVNESTPNCKLDFVINSDAEDDGGNDSGDGNNGGNDTNISKRYRVYVKTHDALTQPIDQVSLQLGDLTLTTNEYGQAEFHQLSEGNYELVASKDGYVFAPVYFGLGNEDYNQEVAIEPVSELGISVKPATWKAIKQGSTHSYLITVINGGNETATGVTLQDVIPEGAKVVSLSALDSGSCDVGTVTCTLPDLTLGAMAQVKLVIGDLPANHIVNTATVSSNEYPDAFKKTHNHVNPYLSVTIDDLPDPVFMEGKLHYSIGIDLNEYAPEDTANNVHVTARLPEGVALDTVSTEHGRCETEEGKILCTLEDLSIGSPEAVSHATIEVDVTLTDAGLLELMHEASVTADNYPTDMTSERTSIFVGDVKVDMVLVLDTTHSMHEEINGVIVALKQFIKERMDGSMQVALVEFKDNVRLRAFTQDMNVLLEAVENLTVEGGNTCPEASVEALNLAVDHLKDGGVIFFSTDASPYEEADVDALYERIKSKTIQLNVVISGDCSDGETAWNDVAN